MPFLTACLNRLPADPLSWWSSSLGFLFTLVSAPGCHYFYKLVNIARSWITNISSLNSGRYVFLKSSHLILFQSVAVWQDQSESCWGGRGGSGLATASLQTFAAKIKTKIKAFLYFGKSFFPSHRGLLIGGVNASCVTNKKAHAVTNPIGWQNITDRSLIQSSSIYLFNFLPIDGLIGPTLSISPVLGKKPSSLLKVKVRFNRKSQSFLHFSTVAL